jgi:hypothetical protein
MMVILLRDRVEHRHASAETGDTTAQLLGVASVQMLAPDCSRDRWRSRPGMRRIRSSQSPSLPRSRCCTWRCSGIIALTYVWLLTREPAQKVATYALVNPVIAVLLGAIVLARPSRPGPSLALL